MAPHLAPLAGIRKSVVVWDRRGHSTIASLLGPRARVFRSADEYRAGEAVGAAAVRAGCREVWYVNPYADVDWPWERLRGLADRVAAARVTVHTVVADGAALADPDGARDSVSTVRRRLLDHCIDITDPFEERFGYAWSRTLGELTAEVRRRDRREAVGRLLQPHLERIVRSGNAAVVGCNDQVAQECVRMLAQRRGGQRVGVYGFDDSFAATLNRFSSYNFNDHGVVRALIASLLYPCGTSQTRGRGRERRIEGFVTMRDR